MTIEKALKTLSSLSEEEDPGQSSHWKKHMSHSNWASSVLGHRAGLGEFIPWKFRHALLHHVMQTPFRHLGREFSSFGETLIAAKRNAGKHRRVLDIDDLRQVLSIACVRHHVKLTSQMPATIAVIGDGYARLSSLLLDTLPSIRIVLVNLPRALYIDLISLQQLRPNLSVTLLDGNTEANDAQVIAIPSNRSDELRKIAIDGAFNISSMQEMNPSTVEKYFYLLRNNRANSTWFYCANVTSKRLPDGALSRFNDYPWSPLDDIIFDGLCPWVQKGYYVWPPSYFPRPYEMRHRLVRLAKGI